MLLFNLEELKKTLIDFYNVTGVVIALYDAQKNRIYAYPEEQCEFCGEIRKDPKIDKKCVECDNYGFDKCAHSKKLEIYKCHMGLFEAVSPIKKDDIIMGYLLIGQFMSENNKEAIIENMKSINIKSEDLYSKLNNIQLLSYEKIKSLASLVNMCAHYLILENIVNIRHDGLPDVILRYIKENISEKLTVKSICDYFYISKSHLYSVSINNFGVGISEFIRIQRVKRAKYLLADSNMPINAIAEAVGIPDTVQFIKIFKRYEEMTPKQYRKKIINLQE